MIVYTVQNKLWIKELVCSSLHYPFKHIVPTPGCTITLNLGQLSSCPCPFLLQGEDFPGHLSPRGQAARAEQDQLTWALILSQKNLKYFILNLFCTVTTLQRAWCMNMLKDHQYWRNMLKPYCTQKGQNCL